jgi:hypothetical protein
MDELFGELDQWHRDLLTALADRLVEGWIEREFLARAVWPEDREHVFIDVAPGDGGLRPGIKMPDGTGQPLRGRVAAVTQMTSSGSDKPLPTVRLFRSRALGSARWGNLTPDDPDWLVIALYAQMLLGKAGAVCIDSMSGSRNVFVRGAKKPAKQAAGLKSYRLDEDEHGFEQGLRDAIRRVSTRLKAADLEPTAGPACDFCRFGELCRFSSNFGESDSPFDGERE